MPRVNKVMEPYDKQMKLTAFLFLERNLVYIIGGIYDMT